MRERQKVSALLSQCPSSSHRVIGNPHALGACDCRFESCWLDKGDTLHPRDIPRGMRPVPFFSK
nr:MAG TPA: hypothetical protein [Bacteriophage sp.]